MFCTTSAVVFVILGQVLVIFYKTAASSTLELSRLLCVQNDLSAIAVYLNSRFTPILLTNCAHIFFCLIFFVHSFLSFASDMDQLSQTIWDGLWIVEGLVRLWLICSTADAIRDSVYVIILTRSYSTYYLSLAFFYRHVLVSILCDIFEFPLPMHVLNVFR